MGRVLIVVGLVLIAGQAGGRVPQSGGGDQVVEEPQVAPVPVVGAALEMQAAADEPEADLFADDLGASVLHRRR